MINTKHLAVVLLLCTAILNVQVFGAEEGGFRSQEMSEKEGIPVLIKHLPEWETKRHSAIFVNRLQDLQTYLNGREVFDRIDFVPGTEAVIASYPEGKLVIVEFQTPQASTDADQKIRQYQESSAGGFFYRRIGNYNVFIFDGTDQSAANALFDQIKYEKVVQWLGPEPGFFTGGESERDFIVGASSLFISTVIVIVSGLGGSAIVGVIVGLLYFYLREQRRASMTSFSDFGGLTRLNLDGLSTDSASGKLLKD